MAKTKIQTPAQKQTAAAAKAEIAKQAAAPKAPKAAPLTKGEQATIAAVGAAVQAKPAPAPKAPKAPKPAPAPKAPRPVRPEGLPDHWTMSGNKKHQCNGPQTWSAVFLAAAKAAVLPGGQVREGDGVRLALAIGVAELAKKHGITLAVTK